MTKKDLRNWMAAGPQIGETVEDENGERGVVLEHSPNYLQVWFLRGIEVVCAHTHPVVE